MMQEPLWDKQAIVDKFGTSDEFLVSVVQLFLKDTQQYLKDLSQVIENKEMEGIRSLAHTIKGSCANLALMELSHLSAMLEKEAKDKQNLYIIENLYIDLIQKWDESAGILEIYLSQNQQNKTINLTNKELVEELIALKLMVENSEFIDTSNTKLFKALMPKEIEKKVDILKTLVDSFDFAKSIMIIDDVIIILKK
jgi:HPt (histidine-containing phosphotransfer) domain-containing protein